MVVPGRWTEVASRDQPGPWGQGRGRAGGLTGAHAGAAAGGLDRGQRRLLLRFRRQTTQDRFTVHPDGRFANEHVALQRVLPLRREPSQRQQGGLLPRLGVLTMAQAADGGRGLPGVAATLAVRAVGPGTDVEVLNGESFFADRLRDQVPDGREAGDALTGLFDHLPTVPDLAVDVGQVLLQLLGEVLLSQGQSSDDALLLLLDHGNGFFLHRG